MFLSLASYLISRHGGRLLDVDGDVHDGLNLEDVFDGRDGVVVGIDGDDRDRLFADAGRRRRRRRRRCRRRLVDLSVDGVGHLDGSGIIGPQQGREQRACTGSD